MGAAVVGEKMNWLIDDLVTASADEVSQWLAELGLPGLTFVFWDPDLHRVVSWQEATEAARRHVLEALLTGPAAPDLPDLPGVSSLV